MDRIKKSLRESFRRKKGQHSYEASKPIEWQADELAVRSGTCNFQVKYLGCTEVFESRGMQVCEEAFKVLKGLIVDQTIEKVSFCAPDRNYDRGFSYICRDGATRRWMCHGFLAVKYSGERLSHAVGCAFAACLERKQARDKECGVAIKFDGNNQTSFTRFGSFKTSSLTDKLGTQEDIQSHFSEISITDKPRELPVTARERPTVKLDLLRQASFRGPQLTSKSFSPFKKQLSLRLMELPSTLQRREEYTSKDNYLTDLSEPRGDRSTLTDAHKIATVSAFVPNGFAPLTNGYSDHKVPSGYPLNPPSISDPSGPVDDSEDSIKRLCRQITQDFAPLSSSSNFGGPDSVPRTSNTGFHLYVPPNGHLLNGINGLGTNGHKADATLENDSRKITNPFLESHNLLPNFGEVGTTQSYPYSHHPLDRDYTSSYNPATPLRLDGRTAMVHPFLKSTITSLAAANAQIITNGDLGSVALPPPHNDNDVKSHGASTKRNTNPFLSTVPGNNHSHPLTNYSPPSYL